MAIADGWAELRQRAECAGSVQSRCRATIHWNKSRRVHWQAEMSCFVRLLSNSSQKVLLFFLLNIYPAGAQSVLFDQLGRISYETRLLWCPCQPRSLYDNYNFSSRSPRHKRPFHGNAYKKAAQAYQIEKCNSFHWSHFRGKKDWVFWSEREEEAGASAT